MGRVRSVERVMNHTISFAIRLLFPFSLVTASTTKYSYVKSYAAIGCSLLGHQIREEKTSVSCDM